MPLPRLRKKTSLRTTASWCDKCMRVIPLTALVTLPLRFQALIDLDRDYSNSEAPLYFLQYIATKKAVRDASVAASKKLNDFSVEIAMRKDIFDLIKYFTDQVGLEGLTHEQKRFVEKEIIDGERNGKTVVVAIDTATLQSIVTVTGLHLPEDQRQEIMKVKKKISELGTTYQSNLNEDNTFLEFTEEELLGVPEDLVKSFEKVCPISLSVTLGERHRDLTLDAIGKTEGDDEVPALLPGDSQVSRARDPQAYGDCVSIKVPQREHTGLGGNHTTSAKAGRAAGLRQSCVLRARGA